MAGKLQVLFYIPTLQGGGAEKVFVNLLNYFHNQGIEITLITSYENDGYWQLLDGKINVVKIVSQKYFKLRRFDALHRFLFTYIKLSQLLIKTKPQYLFTTLDEANIFAYLTSGWSKNTKLIIRQASIFSKDKGSGLRVSFLAKAFKKAYKIIANSPDTSNSIEAFLGKQSNILTIGNPVFNSEMQALGKLSIQDTPFEKNKKYILGVGRLEKIKNYELLINAFNLLSLKFTDLQLVILGKGSLEDSLKQLVESFSLGSRVHFIGFVDNPYPYYHNAEVFVSSSIYEGFGNVIVEALAQGTPVITTDCPGGPKYILKDGKYGSIVPLGNPQLMADTISEILIDRTKLDSNLLIERAKEFSIENIGFEYLQALELK
ncbi:MAG: glycosyltransferase [Bacteroidota bacterium]